MFTTISGASPTLFVSTIINQHKLLTDNSAHESANRGNMNFAENAVHPEPFTCPIHCVAHKRTTMTFRMGCHLLVPLFFVE